MPIYLLGGPFVAANDLGSQADVHVLIIVHNYVVQNLDFYVQSRYYIFYGCASFFNDQTIKIQLVGGVKHSLCSISYMGCHPKPIDELHNFSRW